MVWAGVIGLTENEYVPWEILSEVFKRSAQAASWHPVLLEHQSVHINASLPSQCRSKLSSYPLDLMLCVDSHTIPIIIFKKVRSKDPSFVYDRPHCYILLT